jgi:hypothetical protein
MRAPSQPSDAIHRFCGSKPQPLLAESAGFFGFGGPSSCLAERITQPTSDQQRFIFANPFQPSTLATLVLRNQECSDVRHKFFEQACFLLLKKGVMPRTAALVPTRKAHLPGCSLSILPR